jgi:hypothetical protein
LREVFCEQILIIFFNFLLALQNFFNYNTAMEFIIFYHDDGREIFQMRKKKKNEENPRAEKLIFLNVE